MAHFLTNIRSEEMGNLAFFFDRITTDNEPHYHLSVVTASSKTFHFTMKPNGTGWKIMNAPAPPDWITKLENKLSEALRVHLKE